MIRIYSNRIPGDRVRQRLVEARRARVLQCNRPLILPFKISNIISERTYQEELLISGKGVWMRMSVYNFAFGPAFCTEAWKKVGDWAGL